MFALSAVLTRLPERPSHRLADVLGGVLYRALPERRRLVRGNLERVSAYLVSHDLANEATAAAARDPRALDALVRAAFGHWIRGYLEGATLTRYGTSKALERVLPDNPAVAAEAFPDGRRGPLIVVGLHFGSVEIPALWATNRGVPMTAPMETVSDPHVQAYFEHSRGSTGLTVIPLEGAAAKVRSALARGETVALVADRPISGSGTRVSLFGAPARLPLGPAALALESGAPVWVSATRRIGSGEYKTRLERVELQASGTPRERLSAFMQAEAHAFERAVADAPEQWWTLFFRIWDDIA
jgi:KDO2-lipid IV(A) lauroyltransferase